MAVERAERTQHAGDATGLGAGAAALVGLGGIGYATAFMVYLKTGSTPAATTAAALLLGGGLVAVPALTAVHGVLRDTDPWLALVALILGIAGVLGSAVHGGYDLANFIQPPAAVAGDLPNVVDPRGLATFGLTGVSIGLFSWLIWRGAALPRQLGALGLVTAVLLVALYFGRLIVLNPHNPFLLAIAAAAGFLASPAWFLWLGWALPRAPRLSAQ